LHYRKGNKIYVDEGSTLLTYTKYSEGYIYIYIDKQFRLALMKSGHTDLAKYVNKPNDKEDEILLNGRDDNRCMLYYSGGDC
jgi:hypothetical protein